MPSCEFGAAGPFFVGEIMQYHIVPKASGLAPRPSELLIHATLADMQRVLPPDELGELLAVDLETRGTAAHAPDNYIVGIGIANATRVFYVDVATASAEASAYLFDHLRWASLTAFNVGFDAAFLQAATGEWLGWVACSYAMFKNLTTEYFRGQKWDLETAQLHVLGWDLSNKATLRDALTAAGLAKADMYLLPPDVLGPYCATDADAAWQLYHYLGPLQTEQQRDYHKRLFMNEVKLLTAQQFRGMRADQERLAECSIDLDADIAARMDTFLKHGDVAPFIQERLAAATIAWQAREPATTTKAGTPAARHAAWAAKRPTAAEVFNPNSKPQLKELFFEHLDFKPRTYTATGGASIDRKVLPLLGSAGPILAQYNKLIKQRGYLARVRERSDEDGLVHAQFNSCGTVTTRLGGSGGLNMQQMPKVPAFLWALRARPGHALIQADVEALEPVILTAFSQDPAMLQLYGPGAPPNDIYLFVAAKIPALGKNIVQYYDPAAPTKEGIAAAKKNCKRDRDVAKLVHLSCIYGAGPEKIHETLTFAGIAISLSEVRQIVRDYWRLFGGVKKWANRLLDIWDATGGFIPTMLGRPHCVDQRLLKDIVNRHTQTSGHEFLQVWLWHTERLRQERGVPMHPWLIDLHDEMFWEVPEAEAAAASQVVADALDAANAEVGLAIPLKGPPAIVHNLAEAKCEGYEKWLAARRA